MLNILNALPGCRQSVSTAASAGYAANVVQLLEEAAGSNLFDKIEADQPSSGKALTIFSPLRRGVLIDNRQSCHSTQPGNGIWVPDFDASARVLELSGGTYALGGASAVRAWLLTAAAAGALALARRRPVRRLGGPEGGPLAARLRRGGACGSPVAVR